MKKIIATVGPSLLHTTPITEIHGENIIYRINGAHGSIDDIEKYILKIREQVPEAPILMDLPGNKVRTFFPNGDTIELSEGTVFTIPFTHFNYTKFHTHLKVGTVIWANDSVFKFIVHKIDSAKEEIHLLSKSNGTLQNNKGMHARGIHHGIPFLFSKDKKLIDLANKHELAYIGLSFVRNAEDIREAKVLINDKARIISKVETAAAVENLIEIIHEVKYILIDRGDLSTEIGLHKVPSYQEYIIDKALFYGKKVFLATQFLKNMELLPIPTIPEVIDMHNTLKSGIFGIQMSEETAVGKYPKACIETINSIIAEIESERIS